MFSAAFKSFLAGVLCLLAVTVPRPAQAAGVTIITHGYDGDVTGWITAMAEAVPGYYQGRYPDLSTNFTVYTMKVTYQSGSYLFAISTNGSPPASTESGEIIVKLDWSELAGGPTAPYDLSTSNVARAVSLVLMQTNAIAQLNGHALVEFPLHLIGHSRGGSLMSELSRQLGTNGLWVDQLTTLDPHPLNNDGFDDFPVSVVDAPVHTYANVLFHDNYWQDLGNGLLDPDGEPVAGAYVRQLTSLAGGYINDDIFNDEYQYHSNVHLWYYGTMKTNVPTSYSDDGTEVTIDATMRTNWWVGYEDRGSNAGFEYSLIGGGNRLSTDRPLGLPDDPAIRDGYNQNWDLGAGTSANRTALPSNNGTWPNIIKFDVMGTNSVMAGNLINTELYYQYAGASNLMVQIFFDEDLNPNNSNSVSIVSLQPPATGPGAVSYYSNLGLTTTNVAPGRYSIYARISDGRHTRYLYAPELVQISSPLEPPILDIEALGNGQYVIGINGVSGQQLALQSSSNLQNWVSLATNILTGNRWTYTNSPAASTQFYRALVSP